MSLHNDMPGHKSYGSEKVYYQGLFTSTGYTKAQKPEKCIAHSTSRGAHRRRRKKSVSNVACWISSEMHLPPRKLWNVHPATQLLDVNGGDLESLYLGVGDRDSLMSHPRDYTHQYVEASFRVGLLLGNAITIGSSTLTEIHTSENCLQLPINLSL